MKLLFKYIAKNFCKWLLWISLLLIVIVLLFDFAELLRRSASKIDLNTFKVFKMCLLKLPKLYLQILPFIILFSAILTFWTFNRNNELTIFRSSGLSVWKMTWPMIVAVTLLGVFEIAVLNPLASILLLRYEHLEDRYFKGHLGSLAVSDSGLWFREVDQDIQTVYHVGKIDVATQSVKPLSIFRTNDKDQFTQRLDAEQAVFYGTKIYLKHVYLTQGANLPTFHKDYEISTHITFHALQDSGADPASISFWSLPEYIKKLESSGLSAHKYVLHWHGVLSKCLWFSVMILLAACCCLNPMRQGKTTRLILIGVGVAFIMYVLKDMSMALGLSLKLPVILAAWLPTVMSGLLGITVLLYSEDG